MKNCCCTHDCNEGRDCPHALDSSRAALILPSVHEKDGGHKVRDDDHVLLPLDRHLPELIARPRRAGAASALVAFLFH